MVRRGRITTQSCRLETPVGEIIYSLKRSSVRRSLGISINPKAQVSVLVPECLADNHVRKFILDKSDWIVSKLKNLQQQQEKLKRYVHGQQFLFLGQKYPLEVDRKDIRKPTINFDSQKWGLSLPVGFSLKEEEGAIKEELVKWYRAQANEILGVRLCNYARGLNLSPQKIVIRTQKRLWGCCDFNNQSITLNWQIILAPVEVIDYVIVHELCHLLVPNHSKRFWSKVKSFMPDFERQKKWLKENHLEMLLP